MALSISRLAIRRGTDFLTTGDAMDTTTLLIIVIVLLVLGGGWYGRGRWY
jgi:hypothetical protein